jgi:hypothetical protein
MCGCDGSSTTRVAACGACGRCRRRRKKSATAAMEIAAIPPTTPPAMAPAFEPPVAVGVGVDGDVKPWIEDVSVDPVGFEEVRVAPVPVPVVGEPEVPIRAPGPISGKSENTVVDRRKEQDGGRFLPPVAIDLLAFQKFSS